MTSCDPDHTDRLRRRRSGSRGDMTQQDHLEAFDEDETDVDFANEHEDTTVDSDVSGDRDKAEPETPEGWSGLDQDGPP